MTVYMNSIAINLGRPEFQQHATGVAVDLSDESRKLAEQIRDAMRSGDEVAELRLTKAFVQSLTPEQREDVGRLIEDLQDEG